MSGKTPRGSTTAPARTSPGRHRRRRPRWSTKRRVLTGLGVFVVLLGLIVGGGYLYLQYEWGKVKKVECSSCAVVPVSSIAPFNVLIIGSDTRAGNTGQAAKSFGTEAQNGGQRSDTIKILHVDPKLGSAQILSIPRDTWVEMSGVPQSTGLSGPEKINTAFNGSGSVGSGINALTETIQNTFGIPINHAIVIDFQGLINAVYAVGGINMNVPFPVRDRDCSTGYCNDNSGLDITTTGCQTLNGNVVLALARSRFFEYDDPAEGGWTYDGSGDIGRIERQDLIIEALIKKVESTYNPLTLRSFLSSVVHDITIDNKLGLGTVYSLATRYHAFSPSKLVTYTLPTTSASNEGGSVQIVQEPMAQQMITQFLGTAPQTASTPPLDVNDDPMPVNSSSGQTTTTSPPSTSTSSTSSATSTSSGTSTGSQSSTTQSDTTQIAPYDPTPC